MSSSLTQHGSTRRWRTIRAQVLTRDAGYCWVCGEPGADSVDHLVPRHLGGGDDLGNLAAAHVGCNSGRGGWRRLESKPSREW